MTSRGPAEGPRRRGRADDATEASSKAALPLKPAPRPCCVCSLVLCFPAGSAVAVAHRDAAPSPAADAAAVVCSKPALSPLFSPLPLCSAHPPPPPPLSSPAMPTTLSSRAYLKLILHAAKYQSRAVMGIIIAGPASAAAAASASSASSSAASTPLAIIDVLPLFHTAPLAPMIELALSQCELLLKNYPAGSSLAGLYYAPELYEPKTNSLGEAVLPMPQCNVVCKIADKLTANGAAPKSGARIILVRQTTASTCASTHLRRCHSG